MRLILSYK